jgi:hypothetical protein
MDRKMLDYLPEIMKDADEFIQISEAEQTAKEQMWDNIYRMFDEGFVSTQTDTGLKRWEETLGITPKDTDTLEMRKVSVLGRLLSNIPYSIRTFKAMLDNMCGSHGYAVKLDDTVVKIVVSLDYKKTLDNITELADEVVPAHMQIDIGLNYNKHRMLRNIGITNSQLQLFTHEQIPEEPLLADGSIGIYCNTNYTLYRGGITNKQLHIYTNSQISEEPSLADGVI